MSFARNQSICPVCAAELGALAKRCYHCGSALDEWWPLEKSIQELGPTPVQRRINIWGWVFLGLTAGFLIGWLPRILFSPPAQISKEAQINKPVAGQTAEQPKLPAPRQGSEVIEYHIQRGDSLWRIAAGFTGEGRNWAKLWPERKNALIKEGTLIQLDLGKIRTTGPPESQIFK